MRRVLVGISPMLASFDLGSSHVAHIHLTNPTSRSLVYTGGLSSAAFNQLYTFGATAVGPGATGTVNITVVIGGMGFGTQDVTLYVDCEGERLFNQVIDQITIIDTSPAGVSAAISWD